MPRSVGLFRAAGFPVTAYPVDYRSYGNWRDFRPTWGLSQGLDALDWAVRGGKIKPGETVMLEGVGGGFTWGAVLLNL